MKDINGETIKKGDRVIVRDEYSGFNTLVTVQEVRETGDSLTSGIMVWDVLLQKEVLLQEEYYKFRVIEIPDVSME